MKRERERRGGGEREEEERPLIRTSTDANSGELRDENCVVFANSS